MWCVGPITLAAKGCQDTPGWRNKYGSDCHAFLDDGHCRGGGFLKGHEWAAGAEFGSPGVHCCVCGKSDDGWNEQEQDYDQDEEDYESNDENNADSYDYGNDDEEQKCECWHLQHLCMTYPGMEVTHILA